MSNEQKKFLKSIKRRKLIVLMSQILIVVAFFGIWEYLANKNIINSFVFSKPSKIINTIINLGIQNNLFNHIFVTLEEVLIAFILGIVLGFFVAIILYEFPMLSSIMDPFLTMINSLPKVALGPLIIIIAGANIKSVIIMALLISVIVTVITVYNGFISTDKNRINLLKSFSATKGQIFKYVILPSSYSTIISSLKINISMTLIGVIMGEFLVSKSGIGYLINYGSQVFNLNLVISGIIILMVVSYLMYIIVSYIEKILVKND